MESNSRAVSARSAGRAPVGNPRIIPWRQDGLAPRSKAAQDNPPMRPNPFRATNIVLALLCLMYFLTYLDRVNISTATASNEFLKEIPLTKTQAGLIFSAFAYPYLLFQIGGGWVADKFGARVALTICGVIWAGATVMMGLVHGAVMLFAARVVLGLGEGATFPTATRAMSYWM